MCPARTLIWRWKGNRVPPCLVIFQAAPTADSRIPGRQRNILFTQVITSCSVRRGRRMVRRQRCLTRRPLFGKPPEPPAMPCRWFFGFWSPPPAVPGPVKCTGASVRQDPLLRKIAEMDRSCRLFGRFAGSLRCEARSVHLSFRLESASAKAGPPKHVLGFEPAEVERFRGKAMR